MEKLLVHPRLTRGESLPGYILRLSEINGYKFPQIILAIAGEDRPETLNILAVDRPLLERVAPVVGRSVAELETGLYRLESTVTTPKFAMWGDLKMPLVALRKKYYPVCPECLKEQSYIRESWDWSTVTSCPVHHMVLVDICENCGMRLTRFRPGVSKCGCGFDLRDSTGLVRELFPSISYNELSAGPLCEYGHYARLATVVNLAALLADAASPIPKVRVFARARVLQQHKAIGMASEIWRRGGFTKFLQEFMSVRMGLFPDYGPRMALLPIHHERHELLALNFERLQEAAALVIPQVKVMDSAKVENVPVMNANDVGFILNLSARTISLSKQFKEISPLAAAPFRARHHPVFAAREVLPLLKKLKSDIADQSPIYCFKDLSHPRGVPGIVGTLRLLGALRGGQIRIVHFDPTKGIPSIRFQLCGAQHPNFSNAKPEYVSVEVAAEQLKIYKAAVYRLISAKLLEAHTIGRIYQVPVSAIEEFSRKFVFTREIADKVGFNVKHLAEKLMTLGYEACSGPRIDGALIYVFGRDDTDEIDLVRLKSLILYHTYGGRKPRAGVQYLEPVLRCAEVARRLNISVLAVTKLAKGGWLKFEEGPEIFNKKARFRDSEVLKYESDFRRNPELLSLEQAAVAMGVTVLYIRCRWIGTPYITHISDGLVTYIRKDEFIKLISDRHENLTYGDLIDESGVKRAVLQNWIKIGLLRPIVTGQYSVRKFSLFSRQTLQEVRTLAISKMAILDG